MESLELAPLEAAEAPIDTITRIAARSAIARFFWPPYPRVAPIGYTKGMAVVFARVLCKLAAGDPAAIEMAKANTGNATRDALAYYAGVFAGLGMRNDVSGPDTLRHLFTLMVGHGMQESSGKILRGARSTRTAKSDCQEGGGRAAADQLRRQRRQSLAARAVCQLHGKARRVRGRLPGNAAHGVRQTTSRISAPGRAGIFRNCPRNSPAFAVEFAGVTLRNRRTHYGPINSHAADVMPDCDAMLREVQDFVTASPASCPLLL